jgi:hypothetical protein
VFPVRYELNICCVEESRRRLWSSGQSSWLQSGDLLCFLWDTNWIYICYVEESRRLLWCSGQSSWLQTQRSVFDSSSYQIFWVVLGLEQGPPSLVISIGEKNREIEITIEITAVGDPPRWLRDTPLSTKVVTNYAGKRRSLGRLYFARGLRPLSLFGCLFFSVIISKMQELRSYVGENTLRLHCDDISVKETWYVAWLGWFESAVIINADAAGVGIEV